MSRDRKNGLKDITRDVCPHMEITYYESDEYYWFSAPAFIYCKQCKKEYEIENGVPE